MAQGIKDRWFKEYRYAWIKESVEIFGQINRENIVRKFGMSIQAASWDIEEVLKRWPELMSYNKSTKRYERNGDSAIGARHIPDEWAQNRRNNLRRGME